MITKFKLFEGKIIRNLNDPFFKETEMYFLEIRENGHEGFTMHQVIELSKKLVDILNKNNIIFRTYFFENKSVIFLFNSDISDKIELDINLTSVKTFHILDHLFDFLIPNNDIDLYFDTKKYNL